MIQAAKIIGKGLATTGLIGTNAGIVIIFVLFTFIILFTLGMQLLLSAIYNQYFEINSHVHRLQLTKELVQEFGQLHIYYYLVCVSGNCGYRRFIRRVSVIFFFSFLLNLKSMT